ncbi:MAG: hypothetical protein ACXVAB_13350 [Thermodesulfobacteriota bacterium]
MFTGIIEDKGKVLRIEHRGQEKRLTIGFLPQLTELQLGDSINVNGVCLTVVQKKEQKIELDLSQETLQKTVLGDLKEGEYVSLTNEELATLKKEAFGK